MIGLLHVLYFCVDPIPPVGGVEVPVSQQYHPEELSKKALVIIERVRQKLTGTVTIA